MLHQPNITQEMFIKHNGAMYEAWLLGKLDYSNLSELNGREVDLVCELTEVPNKDDGFYGICRLKKKN